MKRKKSPEIIDIPVEELENIKLRIGSGIILEEDTKVVLTILGTYSWLMRQLQSTKFTINRLKKMFGFSTEKHKNVGSKKGPADFTPEGTSANQVLSLDNLQGISTGVPEKK
jgi:hypothetical protein